MRDVFTCNPDLDRVMSSSAAEIERLAHEIQTFELTIDQTEWRLRKIKDLANHIYLCTTASRITAYEQSYDHNSRPREGPH
jgi:hypothetical protein